MYHQHTSSILLSYWKLLRERKTWYTTAFHQTVESHCNENEEKRGHLLRVERYNNALILCYGSCSCHYGLLWGFEFVTLRNVMKRKKNEKQTFFLYIQRQSSCNSVSELSHNRMKIRLNGKIYKICHNLSFIVLMQKFQN